MFLRLYKSELGIKFLCVNIQSKVYKIKNHEFITIKIKILFYIDLLYDLYRHIYV